jgi:MraZ protein
MASATIQVRVNTLMNSWISRPTPGSIQTNPFDAHVSPCYPILAQERIVSPGVSILDTAAERPVKPRRKRGPSGQMTQFMGPHHNRLDAKGRVSIPAPFRATLRELAPEGASAALVLRPSHKHDCIEGWPAADFQRLGATLERLDVFSEEQDDLTFAFYADATELVPDKEGRIVLPELLATHAKLTDAVVFVGMRDHFEIWEPAAIERRRAEARMRARGFSLPARSA